jgi:hypothetical protein
MKIPEEFYFPRKKLYPGADFSYIFFRGNSLSMENSAEFIVKTIFQNFFRGKFIFFPIIFGGKFSAKFSAEFSPEKMYEKSAPGVDILYIFIRWE